MSKNNKKKKILLALLPFWDPMMPPQGIACLKSFLQKHGYSVCTAAVNMENRFLVAYDRYFDIIWKLVPPNRKGDFFHLGHFVLQNHLMAHIRYKKEAEYTRLVKELIYLNYYINVDGNTVFSLIGIIEQFYRDFEQYILDLLAKEQPGIFGVSVFKATLPASLFALKLTRERYPHITTIMGGGIFADHLAPASPNFEAVMEESRDYLDKVFVGEGELLLLRYLQGDLAPGKRFYTREDINGQALDFADKDVPDYSDFDVRQHPYICLGAIGSISCKYSCSFCNEKKFWGEFRSKDVRQTVREMTELYRRYGYQLFFMADAMLNPIASELAREFIRSPVVLYYDSYFRVDPGTGDRESTLLWRQGGLYRVRIGAESGSQHVLDCMSKGITPDQIAGTVSALAAAGIKITTYWVVGHPGETEEDFNETLRLVEEMKNDIWQVEIAPFDYYYSGQTNSEKWASQRKLLYPEEAADMLLVRTWILEPPPSRQETYDRLFRLRDHCTSLGIPNPYSIPEICQADERWHRLHKNAAPPLLDFKKQGNYLDECRRVKKILSAQIPQPDEGDFGFSDFTAEVS